MGQLLDFESPTVEVAGRSDPQVFHGSEEDVARALKQPVMARFDSRPESRNAARAQDEWASAVEQVAGWR